MKNKKLMMAVAAITMCAASFTFTACNNHTHTYEWTTTKTPTCTEKGVETGVCTDGDDTVTRDIAVDPDAHSYGEWAVTAPTYEREGKAYKACAHNADHTIVQVLPKLASPDYTKVKGEGNTYTYTFAHEMGEITFTVDLDHVYEGELTLVTAPTYNTYGIAYKECILEHDDDNEGDNEGGDDGDVENPTTPEPKDAEGGGETTEPTDPDEGETPENPDPEEPEQPAMPKDYLLVLIPMLGMETDDVTCEVKTAPTATTPGEGKYTFNYFGETVTYDAHIPATNSAETVFDNLFNNYVYKFKDQVGKVDVTTTNEANVNGHAVRSSTSYYEFADGVTHTRDNGDYCDYYYYPTGNDKEPVKIIMKSEGQDPQWYTHGDDPADKLKDAMGLDGVAIYVSQINQTFYGVDNLAMGLYSYAKDNNLTVRSTSYTNAGNTVYAFSYQWFNSAKVAQMTNGDPNLDADGNQIYRCDDNLNVVTVEFVLDATGMVSSYDIVITNYSYSYTGSGDVDYYPNALSANNPIKGYEGGNYYVMPGTQVTRKTTYSVTVTKPSEDLKVVIPYKLEDITVDSVNLSVVDGAAVEEDSVVNGTTAQAKAFKITGLSEDVPASLLNATLYLVEDGEETEMPDLLSPAQNAKVRYYFDWADSSIFYLQCRQATGDFTVRVKLGGASLDFVYRVEPSAPESVSANVTVYDPASDLMATNTAKTLSVYAGQEFYVGAYIPDTSNDALTNQGFTVAQVGGNAFDLAEVGTYGKVATCKFDTAGTYTLVVASTADPSVKQELVVTVKEVPDMSDVFSGEYAFGNKTITFGDNNKVTVNDGKAEVTYTYTYDAETMVATLSAPEGGEHDVAYSIVVTPAYGIALAYGEDLEVRDLFFKGVKVEDVLAGTTWEKGGVYLMFLTNSTGVITKDMNKTGPDGSSVSQFKYTCAKDGDNYVVTFDGSGYSFNPSVYNGCTWFNGNYNNFTVTVAFDGENVTGVATGDSAFNKVKTALELAYEALVGTKWSYYDAERPSDGLKYTVQFVSDSEFTISFNDPWYGLSVDRFGYVLEGTAVTGVYNINITPKDSNTDYAIDKSWTDIVGKVTVADGKVTEAVLPVVYEFDRADITLTRVVSLQEASALLTGTVWTFDEEGVKHTLTFESGNKIHSTTSYGDDGYMTYELEETSIDGRFALTVTDYNLDNDGYHCIDIPAGADGSAVFEVYYDDDGKAVLSLVMKLAPDYTFANVNLTLKA